MKSLFLLATWGLSLCPGAFAFASDPMGAASVNPSVGNASAPADSLSWEELTLADPTVFAQDGTYYLTGTRGRGADRFVLYASQDLQHWTRCATALAKGPGIWGQQGFWAPQLLRTGDTYLLTYTASEHTALARAERLTGPYRQAQPLPIDSTAKNIDSFLFCDDDGSWYLYHVRFNHGNYLWVASFDMDRGCIRPETLRPCFGATQPWENTPAYPSNPIMEGPTVVKLEGKYYLFYSANHYRSVDYAVGYAVASSPWGPWEKYAGNPILHRSLLGENGTGHGDLFMGPGNQYYYVYHVHQSPTQVSPRKTRIIGLKVESQDGTLRFSADTTRRIVPLSPKD